MREPAHYLPALKTTRLPKRLLFLDCESTETRHLGTWAQTWKGGALGSTHWTSKKGLRKDQDQVFSTSAELWIEGDSRIRARHRTVLFCVDLPTQLRVSRALVELPVHGWTLTQISLDRQAGWAQFRHGERSLVCSDILSWMPSFTLNAGTPLERIRQLRETVIEILEWIERENLGSFKPTGSGQSYAAFRRRFMPIKPLVHDSEGLLAIERRAMWTGRAEAWRHGHLTEGPYYEYDLQTAYAAIAATCDVPSVYESVITNHGGNLNVKIGGQRTSLYHVRVATDIPVIPIARADRILWPIGRFDAWLWEPEYNLAHKYATIETIYGVHVYRTAPTLRPFAQWVLDRLEAGESSDTRIIQKVVKHWTRCMIGRLSMRYRKWEKFGTVEDPDLALVTYIDIDEDTSTDLLCVGHDRLLLTDVIESADSLPQITGWIMSECRRRLWELMRAAGLEHVVYVDTDSIIVDNHWAATALLNVATEYGWPIARKGEYGSLTIEGPRNISVDQTRRTAGIPLSATRVGSSHYEGSVQRSLAESIRAGELDRVAQTNRRFVMGGIDLRRQHLPNGLTEPYRIEEENVQSRDY